MCAQAVTLGATSGQHSRRFLLSALSSALAVPLWLICFAGPGNDGDPCPGHPRCRAASVRGLAEAHYLFVLSLAGAAWSDAFGLFAVVYARSLMLPRLRPI